MRRTFWLRYLTRRVLAAVVALLGVAVIVFIVTRLLGDPVQLILGQRATAQQTAELRHKLGYDDAIYTQFFRYIGDLVQGNLGVSNYTQQSVLTEIWNRFPATLELAIAGMLLGLLWTIPLGVLAAQRPGGVVDRITRAIAEFGLAIPNFFLGLLLVLLFAYILGWAPAPVGQVDIAAPLPQKVTGMVVIDSLIDGQWTTFWSSLKYLVLPAVTLAITSCPPVMALTRASMITALRSDYVRGARAFGLPPRRVRWYALKNSLVPVMTMAAMTFGFLLGNTVLVETVFSWPGIGLYSVQAMQRFDYAPVLGVVLLGSALYILVYLLSDLVSMAIDPRIREGQT
jgi:ABC-type dipeptide/oligopeptide/nickel transport system permease component